MSTPDITIPPPEDGPPKTIPSDKGYKTPYITMSMNKEFWAEVLVGRTIVGLEWDEKGIEGLVLDDGQRIFIDHKGTGRIFIKD